MADEVNLPLLFCASRSSSVTSLSACFSLSSKASSVTVSSPVPRFAIRFSSSCNLSRCSATYARGTEHSCDAGRSTFSLSVFTHGWKSCCTSWHVPPPPAEPTAAFAALPYLSLICNRLDTLGSPARSGCRNSSPHTGRSGCPRSLPCTHSGRSPGTAGSASPRDHSRRLRGS